MQLIIFNTLLLSKLNRWFCETPFVPTKISLEWTKLDYFRIVEGTRI